MLAGAVTFGAAYVVSVFFGIALTTSRPAAADGAWLFLPLAGPFVFMTRPWLPDDAGALRAVFDPNLVADGIAPCVGVALLTYGLTAPTTVVVPDRAGGLRLIPVPMVLGRGAPGAGVGVVATF